MKPALWVMCVAALCAACLGYAVVLHRETSRTQSAIQVLRTENEALSARAKILEGQMREAGRRPVAVPRTSSVPGMPPPGGKGGSEATFGALLQSDPHLQALYLKSQSVQLAATYGPLFQQLQLTPEQRQRFTAALAEHAERMLDLHTTAAQEKVSPQDPAMVQLRTQADADLAATEAAIAGESNVDQIKNYTRTLPVRALVSQLAGAVAFTSPLSPQQAEQMTQMLASTSAGYQSGKAADWTDVDWAKADAQAKTVLTPEQFATWQNTEPMGGGPSRFMAIVQQRIAAAQKR